MRLFYFNIFGKGNALIDYNSGCILQEFRNEHRREIHIALQAQADIGNLFSLKAGIAIKI